MKWTVSLPGTIALLAALLGPDFACAQDRSAPDTKACAPGERLQAGTAPSMPETSGQGPSAQGLRDNRPGEELSDKLARTDGVLCPPNVDPHIRAPTPDTGRTPVIPPPGSPGGDPSIRPK